MDANAHRPPNKLKKKLAAGEVCVGSTVSISSPTVVEALAHIGLDWLWLETEHTTMSLDSVLTMLQATNGADVSTVVRVPWNDKTMIKRVLDTGPDGVLIPLVNTQEEAEYAVRAMKYPPWGERGAGLGRAQAYGITMGEYMANANDDVLTMLMIEHLQAVENIEKILCVKGVDTVMVGALDLSGSMGLLGQTADPKVEAAIQKVLKACKQQGVPCGIITTDPDTANRRIKEGFQNIILGIDILTLWTSTKKMLDQVVR